MVKEAKAERREYREYIEVRLVPFQLIVSDFSIKGEELWLNQQQ
jgi:hypothetical protein